MRAYLREATLHDASLHIIHPAIPLYFIYGTTTSGGGGPMRRNSIKQFLVKKIK